MKHAVAFIISFYCCVVVCFAQTITYDTWKNFSDSAILPSEIQLQKSNNNVDVVKFKERFYVVFRTAPNHFPSEDATMYIVSSPDFKTWEFEQRINLGGDLREPRFASWNDSLYLYFFKGGKRMLHFEPKELLTTATGGNKNWTPAQSIHLDGYVPWRLRQNKGQLLFSAYNGKDLYNPKHKSDLRLFKSVDGRHFEPISAEPQVSVQTAEEGEFIFDAAGNLYAVVRLEGYGGLICKANADSIANWHCVKTKYKYDSSLLFEHNNEIYLIARNNMDGVFDRSKEGKKAHRRYNLVRFSLTKKKTALFRLDKENLTLTHIMDFPSTGDCSFPGIQKLNDTDYLVMNYSSDFTKKEKVWLRGQLGKTYIYWSILHFK